MARLQQHLLYTNDTPAPTFSPSINDTPAVTFTPNTSGTPTATFTPQYH